MSFTAIDIMQFDTTKSISIGDKYLHKGTGQRVAFIIASALALEPGEKMLIIDNKSLLRSTAEEIIRMLRPLGCKAPLSVYVYDSKAYPCAKSCADIDLMSPQSALNGIDLGQYDRIIYFRHSSVRSKMVTEVHRRLRGVA